MELLPKERCIILILEYLKTDDTHTKSGERPDLNITVKIYRVFYNILI